MLHRATEPLPLPVSRETPLSTSHSMTPSWHVGPGHHWTPWGQTAGHPEGRASRQCPGRGDACAECLRKWRKRGEDEQRAVTEGRCPAEGRARGTRPGRFLWEQPCTWPQSRGSRSLTGSSSLSGARRRPGLPGVCPNGTGGSSPLRGRAYKQIFSEQQVSEENKT